MLLTFGACVLGPWLLDELCGVDVVFKRNVHAHHVVQILFDRSEAISSHVFALEINVGAPLDFVKINAAITGSLESEIIGFKWHWLPWCNGRMSWLAAEAIAALATSSSASISSSSTVAASVSTRWPASTFTSSYLSG